MKKIILGLALILGFTACGNSSKQQTNDAEAVQANEAAVVLTLDEMIASADQYLDKEVTFKGHVTHTCKHAGKRCFMQGADDKLSIRVEAKGEIGGFNRELIGNEIVVTGVLKEKRLTQTEINEMENAIETKSIATDGSEESCDTERANVQAMRDWMKANNKDYFAIYYVDGQKYNEL
ncbi:hypothetical protein [Dysgonomonas massiliensis]|uniref:hypothetical protein n=1 Tax=Dysgonomonas massiliensis TaxID=2040292 RepID=UPI000C7939A5|nr:hypothetical protein [Dysgonomonas massiliensis]